MAYAPATASPMVSLYDDSNAGPNTMVRSVVPVFDLVSPKELPFLKFISGGDDNSPGLNSLSEPCVSTKFEWMEEQDAPLVLIAHDLSPADMLHFRQSVFKGFVTDVGGKNSHTAIVARSMGIPAVVGARSASHLVHEDDWIVIDGDAGVILVNPPQMVIDEYRFRQRQDALVAA